MANRDHADAQMPGLMLRDHANLADAYKQHIHDGGESALGDFLRDEAARREAEADDDRSRVPAPMKVVETVTMNYTDAPPPPAPDDLVQGLRDRARHARAEGNAIATRDAWHFEQAADAIEALRAERDALRDVLKTTEGYERQANARAEAAEAELRIHRERAASLNNMWRHEFSREVEAAADKLFARMAWPHKEIRALAQGGNDG